MDKIGFQSPEAKHTGAPSLRWLTGIWSTASCGLGDGKTTTLTMGQTLLADRKKSLRFAREGFGEGFRLPSIGGHPRQSQQIAQGELHTYARWGEVGKQEHI